VQRKKVLFRPPNRRDLAGTPLPRWDDMVEAAEHPPPSAG
jgi:hypothetical protein